MADLTHELRQLSPEQLRALLSASGHGQLLKKADEQEVEATKREGNRLFREGRAQEAAEAYSRCIEMDPRNAVCLSNRAAAHLKLKEYALAVEDCNNAVELGPSIKPLMRRATAYIALQQWGHAVDDLLAALEFEPRNKECRTKLQTIVDEATGATNGINDFAVLRRAGVRAAVVISVRDGWAQSAVRGNPGPAAVNGHTLFLGEDDRVYLFGGRAVREQKPSIYVQDERDAASWDVVPVQGSDMPTSRAWHTTSALGNGNYCIYGGVSSQGEDPNVHLLIPAAPRGFQWISPRCLQESHEIPSPRSGHSAVSVAEQDKHTRAVYIFGGRTRQGVSNELLCVRSSSASPDANDSLEQLLTIQWEKLGPQDKSDDWPCARDGQSMSLLEESARLIVFGGNGQSNDEKMNDVWQFDLKKSRWTSVECSGDIPAPRSYHTAHIIDQFLFVIGGRTSDSEEGSVYMLDISSAEWFKLPIPKDKTLAPRAWHSSVLTTTGKLFVLGGGTYHGPLKDAAALDLSYFQTIARKLHGDE